MNGRSPRYIERIQELSVEFLAGTDQEFLAPKQRNPAFRNPAFSLSEAAQQAMQQDKTASEQKRNRPGGFYSIGMLLRTSRDRETY